jgi:UDPglucose--hexose-1-phosphate uridylyltransferase
MSEFRRDPFTGRWVVVAEGRGARPNEHAAAAPLTATDPACPFCEGNEQRTPPEVAALRPAGLPHDGPGWSVRAIPNRFPTVSEETGAVVDGSPYARTHRHPGRGVHEVVIASPRHAPGMPHYGADQLRPLFGLLQERVRALEDRPGMSGVLLFENSGPESGGTLWHPHVQIVATELPFPRVAEEERRFSEAGGPRCLLESSTAEDESDGSRWVFGDSHLAVVAPFGSERPYEMRVVPRRHAPSFADASDAEVESLATTLPALLRALGQVAPGASYNWVVHGRGPRTGGTPAFHWHVEVLPRLVRPDGFDLGSGLEVNPVPPEGAASQLRAALDAVRR